LIGSPVVRIFTLGDQVKFCLYRVIFFSGHPVIVNKIGSVKLTTVLRILFEKFHFQIRQNSEILIWSHKIAKISYKQRKTPN
jgi:hypothetical protein